MKQLFLHFIHVPKVNRLLVLFSLVMVMMSLASCDKKDDGDYKDDDKKEQTFKGPEVKVGKGKANSFFKVDKKGTPLEIGVEMTNEAFEDLPKDPMDFANLSFHLVLHQKARDITPFEHVVLDWNPHGHPPMNVFTVPHFDFHFYTITRAEQLAIPPYTPASAAKFDLLPPAGFMPASYNPDPGGVPAMGKHWGDPSNTLPFSHVMTYGSYNGQLAFVEPMVTLAFLQAGTTVKKPYPQPQKFAKAGKWYPTVYNIYMDHQTHKHYVTLTDFVKR